MRLFVILSFGMNIINCQAVFTPTTNAQLRDAVGRCSGFPAWGLPYVCSGGCLGESGDGNCPIFAASDDNTGNPYGPIGTWDVSQVGKLSMVFKHAIHFKQDISGWYYPGIGINIEPHVVVLPGNGNYRNEFMFGDYGISGGYSLWFYAGPNTGGGLPDQAIEYCTLRAVRYSACTYSVSYDNVPDSMGCIIPANYGTPGSSNINIGQEEYQKFTFICNVQCDPGNYNSWSNLDGSRSSFDAHKPYCSSCPTGTYQDEENWVHKSCKVCTTGKYNSNTGQSFCQDCTLGTYQNMTGQSSCHSCPPGKSSTVLGSTLETECLTAIQIRDKFVDTQNPELVPAYNIANSCV